MIRCKWLLLLLLTVVGGCSTGPVSEKAPDADNAPKTGVILLRYSPGSESTEQREEGFLETLSTEFPEVHILSSNQYAGTTAESSLEKAQQLLLKYGNRVQGIFGVNESSASGILRALDESGMVGKVVFVGFDPNERMVEALRERRMEGIALQDPVSMGYLAVKTMTAHLQGETVENEYPQAST